MGAAIAALLTAGVDCLLHFVSTRRRLFTVPVIRLLWMPAVASVCMAACIALVGSERVLITIASAGMVYVVILFALTIWSNGGPRHFRVKYGYLLSR
jgi:hypothetical protein